MKNLAFVLFAVFGLLASCVTSKKYVAFVNKKLEREQVDSTQNKDWLFVNTDQLNQNKNKCKKIASSFIPLMFYWEWGTTIFCDIDQSVTYNYLKNSIYKTADSLNLLEKLGDNKLVISLKQVPGKFMYENKGSVLFLIVAYAAAGKEVIIPESPDLIADYEILSNDSVILKGEIEIKSNGQQQKNIWQSTKKFTWMYLNRYKKETEEMGIELITEINKQIKNQ